MKSEAGEMIKGQHDLNVRVAHCFTVEMKTVNANSLLSGISVCDANNIKCKCQCAMTMTAAMTKVAVKRLL